MSGFGGGGFGSTPQQQSNNPFGQQQPTVPSFGTSNTTMTTPQQQQAPFGNSSFGGTTTAPSNANPFGGGGGGFGGQQQQQQPMMFGASPNTMAPPPASAPSFGPFGSSSNINTQQQQQSFPPAVASTTTTTTPFGGGGGNNTNSPFGPPPSTAAAPALNNNPFGAAAPASGGGMSFGMSSNVIAASSSGTAMTTMNDPSMGGGSGTAASTAAGPFGQQQQQQQQSMSPFGNSNDSGMNLFPGAPPEAASSKKKPSKQPPATNLPFGVPPAAAAASRSDDDDDDGDSRKKPAAAYDVHDDYGGRGAGSSSPPPPAAAGAKPQNQLAALKAKLEAKKARLQAKEEKKKQQQSKQQRRSNQSPPPDTASLAERNAVRFAAASSSSNNATAVQLPADLLQQAAAGAGSSSNSDMFHGGALRRDAQQQRTARHDLTAAVALTGTCPYMCPAEELLRRQREGDIQLLEQLAPMSSDGQSGIHPADWTLRDTAVKRFRRSAADYKLDVPEWVRPPDVLERTCSYLEEWVMERDRQGPDPRFPNGGTPQSLDVYQFIWDRTRMIRKDFTLQNYVGGSTGKCDARAVRCHERICRWHAMCEHQLSHISDFVEMQSQQNIQELGQTMKTLNQFYDDAMGRSRVEVPDEQGRETRTAESMPDEKFAGCSHTTVQGVNPVDYDGTTALVNNAATGTFCRGSAESEMRGLYILLTIDNDGGMEVLKYAARLCRDRPQIYHSRWVQLALKIYKAKKEYNYVRFFAILRAASTPYLFACVMFKYVEMMRKVAFRICSKTYGARSKDGESAYDVYPLQRLVKILCFENMEEARMACKHYNITVKEASVRPSSSSGGGGDGSVRTEEFVFWRRTPFREPKDPNKGTTIPLKPFKMVRTIESKLKGLTRLAVCRGAASGSSELSSSSVQQLVPLAAAGSRSVAVAAAAAAAAGQQQEDARKLQELKKQEEEKRKRKEAEAEQKRQAEQRKLLEEKKRKEKERLEKEKERQRIQLEQEAARKRAEEKARREREKAEALARKKRQEEEAKRAEAERLRLEALKEQRRLELLRQEEERRRQEEERRRQEAERKRLAELEAARLRELERRRREEEERRRLEEERKREERRKKEAQAELAFREWKRQVDTSRKEVAFRRWLLRFPRQLSMVEQTQQSLSRIGRRRDKGEQIARTLASMPLRGALNSSCASSSSRVTGVRDALETFVRRQSVLPITQILKEILSEKTTVDYSSEGIRGLGENQTLLLRVAVVLPGSRLSQQQSLYGLVRKWLEHGLDLGNQFISSAGTVNLRVVFVEDEDGAEACDAAVAVLLMPADPDNSNRTMMADQEQWTRSVEHVALSLRRGVPCSVLILADDLEEIQHVEPTVSLFADIPGLVHCEAAEGVGGEAALSSCIRSIVKSFTSEESPRVELVSVFGMCSACVNKAIWIETSIESHTHVMERAKTALRCLLHALRMRLPSDKINWPAREFASDSHVVSHYFGGGMHLPLNWASYIETGAVESRVFETSALFDGDIFEVVSSLLVNAPLDAQEKCQTLLDGGRAFRRCLQLAMMGKLRGEDIAHADENCMYLPAGLFDVVLDDVEDRLQEIFQSENAPSEGERQASVTVEDRSTSNRNFSPTTLSLRNDTSNLPLAQPLQDSETSVSRLSGTKKSRPSPEEDSANPKRKVRRLAPQSEALRESSSFTKRLQAMVRGSPGRNMLVGSSTLATLVRDAPDLTDSGN